MVRGTQDAIASWKHVSVQADIERRTSERKVVDELVVGDGHVRRVNVDHSNAGPRGIILPKQAVR
jgi:hypothetical protein